MNPTISTRDHAEIVSAAALNLVACMERHEAGFHEAAADHARAAMEILNDAMRRILPDQEKDGAVALRCLERAEPRRRIGISDLSGG